MATAELVPVEPAEQKVTLTLTKREAAMLVALSGYVCDASQGGINEELYNLLKVAGQEYGMNCFLDGESHLGTGVKHSPDLQFDGEGA